MAVAIAQARRALVTGGAGFIGSHLVRRLLAEGWAVCVLDDFSSGRAENLAEVAGRYVLFRGDLCDEKLVARALAGGVDVVFHQAAIASVPRSVADPLRTHAVNLAGTLGLLEAARRGGVRRFVYASSSAIYGDGPELPKHESLSARPLSPYAVQKHAAELYAKVYTRLHGLASVGLRYFNVYGPRQDPKSDYAAVIPLFVTAALAGAPVCIHGDGEQTRDFVYVDDVVQANLLAATAEGASGEVFNVASGRRTSVNELARVIGERAGRRLETRHEPARAGDVRDSWADVSHSERRLGFKAQVPLERGLELTVEDFAHGRL